LYEKLSTIDSKKGRYANFFERDNFLKDKEGKNIQKELLLSN